MVSMRDRRAFFGVSLGLGGVSLAALGTGLGWGFPLTGAVAQEDLGEGSGTQTVAAGKNGGVATVHPLATGAALRILKGGGNAADAAIAAAFMLAVVDGHNSGLGGGCFILARKPSGQYLAIDGRETAPAAAHPTMFLRDGKADPQLSQTGALATGVPGAVAAYALLGSEMGTGRWKEAVGLAADVAEEGFPIRGHYARRLENVAEEMSLFPATREIFFQDDGKPKQAGSILVQRDLGRLLREIAAGGDAAFYQGTFAEQTARWMRDHGGLITRADLSGYRPAFCEPLRTHFRGHTVYGFPPPSSGGLHVAQILALLERFDLRGLYQHRPHVYYHGVAEAMRLSFADRAEFLGDPAFAKVPRGLLDPEYLRRRAERINLQRRSEHVGAGNPPSADENFSAGTTAPRSSSTLPRHTTHLSVVDRQGNWVAITATINTSFGSKVVIPGTGVVMNNQMDDFAIAPGVPNAFGLVGREANAPEGGKKPLSSMSPTIVEGPEGPVLTCGAAGGPRIISATVQIILGYLALGHGIDRAMQAARIHHQWLPDRLAYEASLDAETRSELLKLGHQLEEVEGIGTAQAIVRAADGTITAAAEPRLPGAAAAY